jgi:hypothetical protein
VAPPRRLASEDEAGEVGARLHGHVDVLLPRQAADLDERPREQLAQLRGRICGAHQRRAHQDRVGTGELRRSALGARLDAALRDHDAVARRACDELQLRAPVDPERREIAGVDPDRVGAQSHRALELLCVVRLDERVETELRSDGHESRRRAVVQVAQQQQRRIGPASRSSRSCDSSRKNPLPSSGHVRRGPRGPQVGQGPAEPRVHQHRDGSCARLPNSGPAPPDPRPAGGRPPRATGA